VSGEVKSRLLGVRALVFIFTTYLNFHFSKKLVRCPVNLLHSNCLFVTPSVCIWKRYSREHFVTHG